MNLMESLEILLARFAKDVMSITTFDFILAFKTCTRKVCSVNYVFMINSIKSELLFIALQVYYIY